MAPTLAELAQRFKPGLPDLEVAGDGATRIEGVCALSPGEAGKLSFLANPRLRDQLATTLAAAVIVTPSNAARLKGAGLVTRDPHLAFARIAAIFDTYDHFTPGVNAAAVVAPGVLIPLSSHVGPCSTIAAGARIGAGVYIGPNCTVGADAQIGDGSRLEGQVFVGARVRIGKRARLGPGAALGYRGFGLARSATGWEEVPQLGSVILGDDVEIGANTTIDRGALGDTVLEDGVKLDNQIQVGHNCRVGKHTVMAGASGIAGSTTVGARCMIGGGALLNGHITVCDDVVITGMSMVMQSITEKGQYSSGLPAQPAKAWRREVATVRRLGEMLQRLRELERRAGIAHGENDGGDEGGEPDV